MGRYGMTRRTGKVAIGVLGIMLGLAGGSRAEPVEFDFKDPKGVNAITIQLDSLLEPIAGYATGISGTLVFDPATPEATAGKIVVEAASIAMTHPVMTKALHTEEWLNVERHPTVEYEIAKVTDVRKTSASSWDLAVSGTLMLKGVRKEKQVTVSATYLPGRLRERNHEGDGDLLVLRCRFSVDRAEFGIQPDLPPVTVAREIQLSVNIVGVATIPRVTP